MIDPAFLDRLQYYLPGWEAPKLEKRLFADQFASYPTSSPRRCDSCTKRAR
jgi:predicted ATP-dependent Lon-type protease